MVYAHYSKSCLARDEGSSPSSGTRIFGIIYMEVLYVPKKEGGEEFGRAREDDSAVLQSNFG